MSQLCTLNHVVEIRACEHIIGGVPTRTLEAGPIRSAETVLVLGTDEPAARQLLSKIGRFARALFVADPSAVVLDSLSPGTLHVVVSIGGDVDPDAVVEILQRSLTID